MKRMSSALESGHLFFCEKEEGADPSRCVHREEGHRQCQA